MKKNTLRLLINVLLVLLCKAAIAQQPTSSTYYFIKPIYAFAVNSVKVSENEASVQGVTYTKGVYGSYARGLAIQIGIGKMINRNIGVELVGEYLHGHKLKSTYSSDDLSIRGDGTSKINAVMIKPKLVLRNSGDLLSIYSKLGLAVSVWSRRYETNSLFLSAGGQDADIDYESLEKIKLKIGFTAAFGLSFRIKEAFAITTELNGQMISLPVKSGHYTNYTLNGRDQLSTMSAADKSWVYKKSISSAQGNSNQPSSRLYEPANFSYIGIAVGIVHYF